MLRKSIAAGSVAALLAAGAVAGTAPALAEQGGVEPHEVTVMSFNIHYGADNKNVFDLERTASVIEDSGAEIIGLQEVDNHWGARSEFIDEAAWLAERLDMHVVYGANLNEPPLPGDVNNRQYGNAILSEFPIVSSENHLLENIEYAERPTEQRGLLEAVVDVDGTDMSFYSTHLDFQREEQRASQVQEILDITSANERPAVIVGDLNAPPDAPELQPLFSVFTDTFAALGQNEDYTFGPDLAGLPGSGSVENPSLRIDYILTGPGAMATSASVVETTASDHLPIIAELSIEKAQEAVPPAPAPALQYPEKIYRTPGFHYYNNRHWATECEPYSKTFRCWTSIWSTQVVAKDGKYVRETGWHHNNLTYLPSARTIWKANRLGYTNEWTAADGRRWYTQCDTPATGRQGCRSYASSDVVEATAKPGGGWSYSVTNKWVFNNIVLFK